MSHSVSTSRPASLLASTVLAISIAILFLSLFTLEISDGLIHGRMAKSLFFFPPTGLLIAGMLKRRRWALLAARLAAALGCLWFFGWSVAAAAWRPVDQHGPVWIWIMCASLVLGSFLLLAFFGLGRTSTKQHYGMVCPNCQHATRGWRWYFARRMHCADCGESWPSQTTSVRRFKDR